MTPVKFDEANVTYAEDQPEYLALPSYLDMSNDERRVTFCWQLTWRERFKLLVTGQLWHQVLTFGGPLQPQLPLVDKPPMPCVP